MARLLGMSTFEVASTVTLAGDGHADFVLPFEEVYRLHAVDVYRFCLALTRNADAAEDATADVFVAACAAYPRVRPSSHKVKFWLLRIARNTVISRWRVGVRRARLDRVLSAVPPRSYDVHEVVVSREDLRAVMTAIARLRRRDRVLIALRAAQLSYEEVADLLRMSEGSARVASHRALRALRVELEES
jgi:RNA polymerase sigma factor (sigma-70 family)